MVRIAAFEVMQEAKQSPRLAPRGKLGWWGKFKTVRKLHEFVEFTQELVAVDLECACPLLEEPMEIGRMMMRLPIDQCVLKRVG
jgi:hypothetical protein